MARFSLLLALLLPISTGLATAQLNYAPGPVPTAILRAHRIFIANGGADSGLFPEPFSGDPNRGYDEFFAAMQEAGQVQLVSDPSLADLVLQLRLIGPEGPKDPDKQSGSPDPLPMFRLKIYDARTRFCLWAITESVEPAVLQRTHDRNFNDAISRVVTDFEMIRQPAQHPTDAKPAQRP